MANQASAEEMALLKADFQDIDGDNDGFISKEELKNMMDEQDMKYTIQEIEIMIDTVDADGDKKLSFKEFVTLMTK